GAGVEPDFRDALAGDVLHDPDADLGLDVEGRHVDRPGYVENGWERPVAFDLDLVRVDRQHGVALPFERAQSLVPVLAAVAGRANHRDDLGHSASILRVALQTTRGSERARLREAAKKGTKHRNTRKTSGLSRGFQAFVCFVASVSQ